MKCPLRSKYEDMPAGNDYHVQLDCLQSECAWWSGVDEECRLVGLDRGLKLIARALLRMRLAIEKGGEKG